MPHIGKLYLCILPACNLYLLLFLRLIAVLCKLGHSISSRIQVFHLHGAILPGYNRLVNVLPDALTFTAFCWFLLKAFHVSEAFFCNVLPV